MSTCDEAVGADRPMSSVDEAARARGGGDAENNDTTDQRLSLNANMQAQIQVELDKEDMKIARQLGSLRNEFPWWRLSLRDPSQLSPNNRGLFSRDDCVS